MQPACSLRIKLYSTKHDNKPFVSTHTLGDKIHSYRKVSFRLEEQSWAETQTRLPILVTSITIACMTT